MTSPEYLGQGLFTVALAPARAAYLIKDQSRSGMRRAIQQASTRWGGASEPIIPVAADGTVTDWWASVVEYADVEAVVSIDVPNEVAEKAAKELGKNLVPLPTMNRLGPTCWTCEPRAVNDPSRGKAFYISVPISTEDGSLWEAVTAGDLSSDDSFILSIATTNPVYRPRTDDQVFRAQFQNQTTWLDCTMSHTGEYHQINGPMNCPAIIWVISGDSFDDCLNYWNLRALRPTTFDQIPMILLPSEGVGAWTGLTELFAFLLKRQDEFKPDAILYSLSTSEKRLHEIAVSIGLSHTSDEVSCGRNWPTEDRAAPFTYRTKHEVEAEGVDIRSWFIFERKRGVSVEVDVQMFRQKTSVRFVSPVPFYQSGYTLLRMEGEPFSALPKRNSVAELIKNTANWKDGSIEIRTAAQREYRFEINIPSQKQAIENVLSRTTRNHSVSEKGLLAINIANRMTISALLGEGVYEGIASLKTPRSKELTRQLKQARKDGNPGDIELAQLAEEWGGRSQRRYQPAQKLQGIPEAKKISVAEKICGLNLAERGLEVKCNLCKVREFVPLPNAAGAGQPRCDGCGTAQDYTRNEYGPAICYRLDSAADHACDQGIFPHLLAMASLLEIDSRSFFLPGVDLEFNDDTKREVDIFGVHKGFVLSGEVKTSSSEFTEEQITHDVDTSKRLGAEIHLIASVDAMPKEVVEIAQERCESASLSLLVLDRTELRPTVAMKK